MPVLLIDLPPAEERDSYDATYIRERTSAKRLKRGFAFAWLAGLALMWLVDRPAFGQLPPGVLGPPELEPAIHIADLPDAAKSVVFSPDGKSLAIGTHDQVQLWDIATKAKLAEIPLKSGFIRSLLYSPDGEHIIAGGYQRWWWIPVSAPDKVEAIKGHRGFITSAAWAPGHAWFATASEDLTVRVWDAATRTERLKIEGFRDPVLGVAVSPDGQTLATAAGDETRLTKAGDVRLWNASTGKLIKKFPAPERGATCVAFSPDGSKLLVGSFDEKVHIHDVGGPEAHLPAVSQNSDNPTPANVAGEPVPATATAEANDSANDSAKTPTFIGHGRPTLTIVIRPTSTDPKSASSEPEALAPAAAPKVAEIIVCSGSGGRFVGKNEIKCWQLRDQKELVNIDFHKGKIHQLAVSPDGRWLAAAAADKSVSVWDLDELLKSDAEPAVDTKSIEGATHNARLLFLARARLRSGSGSGHGREGEVPTEPLEGTCCLEQQTPPTRSWISDTSTTERLGRNLALPTSRTLAMADPTEQPAAADPATAPKRVGIIGLDTSHAIAFTTILNQKNPPEALVGFQMVAAYPPGSPDIEGSVSRVPGYTEEVKKHGVKIVDAIDALVAEVDYVMLETNDGRPHLEQVLPVLRAKKPVFVDKPVAGSLVDAIAIYEAARHFGTPLFSSSSLRYMDDAQAARRGAYGDVKGCDAFSPCSLEKTHPDLYWYGIHGCEILFTVMGTGCQSVSRTSAADTEVAVGVWGDGRVGTFRGTRSGGHGYGGTVFGSKQTVPLGGFKGYEPLVVEIISFFRTGEVPVTEAETLEIYTFMEAADESKRQGGLPVKMSDVLTKARPLALERLKSLGVEITP